MLVAGMSTNCPQYRNIFINMVSSSLHVQCTPRCQIDAELDSEFSTSNKYLSAQGWASLPMQITRLQTTQKKHSCYLTSGLTNPFALWPPQTCFLCTVLSWCTTSAGGRLKTPQGAFTSLSPFL